MNLDRLLASPCRHMAAVLVLGVITAGCGGSEAPPPASADAEVDMGVASQRFVGCISPTVIPTTFVLTVAEPRDFTTGEPAGTPIPQKSELPEGAPPPIPPVTATTGTPGGGPTPTTKLATYTLIGEGGQDLAALVGHSVEVIGRPSSDGASGPATGSIYVTSVRDLAATCK